MLPPVEHGNDTLKQTQRLKVTEIIFSPLKVKVEFIVSVPTSLCVYIELISML